MIYFSENHRQIQFSAPSLFRFCELDFSKIIDLPFGIKYNSIILDPAEGVVFWVGKRMIPKGVATQWLAPAGLPLLLGFLLFACMLLLLLIRSAWRIRRWEGAILFSFYAVYAALLYLLLA
jgi:Ca2+/Na+ antiporter